MNYAYIDSRHDELCRCEGCRPQPPEPGSDVYCLHMDSGAAWHFRDGVNLGRCPSDGCEAGH